MGKFSEGGIGGDGGSWGGGKAELSYKSEALDMAAGQQSKQSIRRR